MIRRLPVDAFSHALIEHTSNKRRARNAIKTFDPMSPADRYLANLSQGSVASTSRALDSIAKLMDTESQTQNEKSSWVYQDVEWAKLRREHVLSLKNIMQCKGLSPKTIAKYLSAIKGVMKEARFMNLISYADYDAIKEVQKPSGSRLPAGEALELTMVQDMIKACDDGTPGGIRDKAILSVMVGQGLRRFEVTSLRLADVNFQAQTIRVVGKGNKERVVEAFPEVILNIEAYLSSVRGTWPGPLFNPVKKNGEVSKKELYPTSIYHICTKRGQQIHTDKIRPHNLRRTCGTALVDQGIDLLTVRDLLGHESIETTKIYIRDDKQARMRQAINRTKIL